MIELRLDKEAPTNACVLAHYAVSPLSPRAHLALWDQSFYDPDNRTGRNLIPTAVLVGESLADSNVVGFINSVVDKGITTPVALPYVWTIGSNTKLGRARYYVYDEAAESIGPFTVGAAVGTQDYLDQRQAESIIRDNIKVLDYQGSEAENLLYDVQITSRNVDSNGFVRFDVNLLMPEQSSRSTYYRLQYNAVRDGLNQVMNSVTEAINSSPALAIVSRDSSDASPGGYVVGAETQLSSNDTTLVEYNASSAIYVNGIALFSTNYQQSVYYSITGTGLSKQLTLTYGSSSTVFTLVPTKSIETLVGEINNSNAPVKASLLTYAGYADDLINTTSPVEMSRFGTKVRLDSHYGVYYEARSKIDVARPLSDVDSSRPWYVRIRNGNYRKRTSNGDVRYSVGDFDNQVFSIRYTAPYKDSYDEPLIRLAPQVLQTIHPNIEISTLDLDVGDKFDNSYIQDYDEVAGVLYTSNLADDVSVRATYSYVESHYLFTGLNLNPTNIHNPDAPTSVYVVYMIPSEINRFAGAFAPGATPSYYPVETYTDNIRYAVGSTVEQALAAVVNDAKTPYGKNLYPVILSVIHITNYLDITDCRKLDCRSLGGGVVSYYEEQPESAYYTGIGYVGGEPFVANGPVVLDIPKSIISTKTDSVEPDPVSAETYTTQGGETEETIRRLYESYGPAGTKEFIRKRNA